MIPGPLKTLRIIFYVCLLSYVYCRLARLTGAFEIILIQCCVLSCLIRRIPNYMVFLIGIHSMQGLTATTRHEADPFHLQRTNKLLDPLQLQRANKLSKV